MEQRPKIIPEERAIAKIKEMFVPYLDNWSDYRIKELDIYNRILVRECYAEFRKAFLDFLRVVGLLEFVKRLRMRCLGVWERIRNHYFNRQKKS